MAPDSADLAKLGKATEDANSQRPDAAALRSMESRRNVTSFAVRIMTHDLLSQPTSTPWPPTCPASSRRRERRSSSSTPTRTPTRPRPGDGGAAGARRRAAAALPRPDGRGVPPGRPPRSWACPRTGPRRQRQRRPAGHDHPGLREPGRPVVYPMPDVRALPHAGRRSRTPVVEVPYDEDYNLPVDELAAGRRPVTFIANAQQPLRHGLAAEAIERAGPPALAACWSSTRPTSTSPTTTAWTWPAS